MGFLFGSVSSTPIDRDRDLLDLRRLVFLRLVFFRGDFRAGASSEVDAGRSGELSLVFVGGSGRRVGELEESGVSLGSGEIESSTIDVLSVVGHRGSIVLRYVNLCGSGRGDRRNHVSVREPCSTKYRAAHDSGHRRAPIEVIVVHSTEGETAEGAAGWFQNPASGGSAHKVVDERICYKTLPDDRVAWAAPGANHNGLHLEFAAFARWNRASWLRPRHRRMLRRGAWKAAGWAVRYSIPLRRLNVDDLRAGKRGITGHVQVSRAFHRSSHWDPGPNFPWRFFMRKVRRYAKRHARRRSKRH